MTCYRVVLVISVALAWLAGGCTSHQVELDVRGKYAVGPNAPVPAQGAPVRVVLGPATGQVDDGRLSGSGGSFAFTGVPADVGLSYYVVVLVDSDGSGSFSASDLRGISEVFVARDGEAHQTFELQPLLLEVQ